MERYMRILTILTVLTALLLATGCGKKAEEPAADKAGATESADKGHEGQMADKGAAAAPAPGAVSITAAGSKFDPPLEIAQVPAGAWYCDMGTAHYACTEKKDGKCPLCKMDLKQKP